jgi:BlaI family penicillinase repressor
MSRTGSEHPTELELMILKVLWKESPLAVREVRDRLATAPLARDLTHSSVITILNIMVRKGFLQREKEGKAFLFSPLSAEREVSRGMLADLLGRLFDGSASAVVLDLLEVSDVDADEIREIRSLINRKAKEQKS